MASAVALEARDESLCSLLVASAVPVLRAMAAKRSGSGHHETKLVLDVVRSLQSMV